ncbi:isochorismate synthase [Tatumella morbirosei]|uniref:isochorismate synthase n=1 Tax=Tatumella morbirosei TaxID=642227 RepID=A0A095UVX3_9GAMM|nr:isochorismate synthase [Tatumella morbirosei]KGD78473.1 isochorismate synthase [Tatumella morbirosei]
MLEKEQAENPCFREFPSLKGRFLFTSGWRSLITDGCFQRLTLPLSGVNPQLSASAESLATAFRHARAAGISRPVVVGAIPFDTRQPSELYIPESYEFFDRQQLTAVATVALNPPAEQALYVRQVPEKNVFTSMVARAVEAMKRGELDKVVLSRLLNIHSPESMDLQALMSQIVQQNPDNYHFHVPLSSGATLLGASPELLLRKQANQFYSCPLAGSAKRASDPLLDQRSGQTLMNSAKDRHEHRLVTDAMRDTLQPVSETLSVPEVPELVTTGTLWHLATSIRGTLKNSHESALSLATLLHPTPALSGFPHSQALALIRQLEPFDRHLFGGMVGWCDDQGNGEWAVTIRCATVDNQDITLFAGAGVVPASNPESEWLETGVKLTTMLKAFGLEQSR